MYVCVYVCVCEFVSVCVCVRGNGVFRRAARGSLGSVVCRRPSRYQTGKPTYQLHPKQKHHQQDRQVSFRPLPGVRSDFLTNNLARVFYERLEWGCDRQLTCW